MYFNSPICVLLHVFVRLNDKAFAWHICRLKYQAACEAQRIQQGSEETQEAQACPALSDSTNQQRTARKGANSTRLNPTLPATDLVKGRARANSKGMQTTGKLSSRPSRYMLAAMAVAT